MVIFFILKSLKDYTLGINSGPGKGNEQKHLVEGHLTLHYMKLGENVPLNMPLFPHSAEAPKR